jgi:hypothetical protein
MYILQQLSPFAARSSVSGPGMWGRRPAGRPTGPLLHTQEPKMIDPKLEFADA